MLDSTILPSVPESAVPMSALEPLVAPLLDTTPRVVLGALGTAEAEQLSLARRAAFGQANENSAGELRCCGSLPESNHGAVPTAAARAPCTKALCAGSWRAAGGIRAESRLHQELF